MTRAKPKNPNRCKDCGQMLLEAGRATRCLIDWTRHPRPAPVYSQLVEVRCIPTVGGVRWLLVCALRYMVEARTRGTKIKQPIQGIANDRAIQLMRRALLGRPERHEVSRFTWHAARSLANATAHVSQKAFWNAPRWAL